MTFPCVYNKGKRKLDHKVVHRRESVDALTLFGPLFSLIRMRSVGHSPHWDRGIHNRRDWVRGSERGPRGDQQRRSCDSNATPTDVNQLFIRLTHSLPYVHATFVHTPPLLGRGSSAIASFFLGLFFRGHWKVSLFLLGSAEENCALAYRCCSEREPQPVA